METKEPTIPSASTSLSSQNIASRPSTLSARLLVSEQQYLSLTLRGCRLDVIMGFVVLLIVSYVVWRFFVVLNEVRRERRRLKENLIWMRQERKRRITKTVGILAPRDRGEAHCAVRPEQMIKKVRFVEMLDGSTGEDSSMDATPGVSLGSDRSIVVPSLDEGLGELF